MQEYFRIAARSEAMTPGVSAKLRFEKARQALSNHGIRIVGLFQSDTAFTVTSKDTTLAQLTMIMDNVERGFWNVTKDVSPLAKATSRQAHRSLHL
ncbi:MAG: hypothetical protein RBR86_05970 [Pseudobdellovibrionaceae bacterium]|jgi:hypothetical protein|nr:hypothetical protein [Pseudobdellovibrionaceae bacterium]